MRDRLRRIHTISVLLLGLFALAVYLLPLGGRELLRPDEFRYAEIPREMLANGTWLSPRLNGVRYYEKPTLGYQLIALSMKCFGENAFALRLPSALATLVSAATIYLLCLKRRRDPWLPGLAAAIFLSFGIIIGIGAYAVLDPPFAAALTVCIGAVFAAYCTDRFRHEVLWLVVAGLAAAAAFMVKGFLAFIIPAVVFVPFLCWERAWKKLFRLPWLPLFIVLLITLPWAWQLHHTEPDFWRYFFIEEHWKRFTSETYDRKAQPPWYFIPILLGGMLPSGALWAAAWIGVGKQWLKDSFIRLLLCWAVLPFILFSASSCKLGTYILPCFAPLALLTAVSFRRAMIVRRRLCRQIVSRMNGVFGWVFIAAAVAAALIPVVVPRFQKLPGITATECILTTLTAVAAALFGTALLRVRRRGIGLQTGLFLLGAAPLILVGMFAIPNAFLGNRASAVGLQKCFQAIPVHAGCTVAVERTCIAPVCWVLKRDDIVVVGKMGEMAYGFKTYPDEYASRYVTEAEFPGLIDRSQSGLIYITFKDLKSSPLPSGWPEPRDTVSSYGVTVMRF